MSQEEPANPTAILAEHRYKPDHHLGRFYTACHCDWTSGILNSGKTAEEMHAEHQLAALKAVGFEITKRSELGVTKGLPGLAESLEALPNNSALNERAMRFAGQNAGIAMAAMLETFAPLSEDQRLTAALDVIGRRTDIVAVQLPEPDEGVWYVNEGGCNVHLGPPGGVLIDARAMLWGINTDEARTLAAALLAAAARADAAEGEAK